MGQESGKAEWGWLIHAWSGRLIGCLLCGMIVFSPWAFGTTQPWSIQAMNVGGWMLGILFVARRLRPILSGGQAVVVDPERAPGFLPAILFALTLLLLAYALVSAWNAAAIYVQNEWRLQDRPFIKWLPHSFDAPSSWAAFWMYLALAGAFWAAWDWLSEARRFTSSTNVPRVSSRLRLILWVIAVNGGILAIEAIIQRTSGTPKLLWFMPTHDNPEAASQFGPYAYRANAAQYLNLVWPVALAFWWWLHHDLSQQATRRGLHHILLPCVVIISAAALFSLSRGGVAVAILVLLGAAVLFASRRGAPLMQRWGVIGLVILIGAAGTFISWKTLGPRLAKSMGDPLAGRKETYELAREMAREYVWFGTGPGTFGPLFQMYRQNPEQYWPGQLHNDWLEFRITFGRVGFGLMLAALVAAAARCLVRGGVPRDPSFLGAVALALGGCLLHARVDFPFQIYSINFLFLLLLAILFSSSRWLERRPA